MAEDRYYSIITSKPQTVNDLILEYEIKLTVKEFLFLNKNSILSQYDAWDEINNIVNIQANDGKLEIKQKTIIIIPKNKLLLEDVYMSSEGLVSYQKNSKLFLGSHIDLIENEKYVRANKLIIKDGVIDISKLSETATVWWYSYANDTIYNILPFITNLSTNKGEVGNFSLSMLPTQHDLNTITPLQDGTYLNQYSTDNINNTEKYYPDFFETYFQENDVIFIKYEELELDKEGKPDNVSGLVIPKQHLHKNPAICWDMIGLVDKCSTQYNSYNSNKEISISGRDFTKMFEKDGSYFLPYQFIQSKNEEAKFVWGGDETSSWFKRNMISGDFNYFFSYDMKSIEDIFKFIIVHLSNLKITPDSLWSSYGDKLAKIDDVSDYNGKVEIKQQGKSLSGIWGIVQLNFDNFIKERRVFSENLINPSGNLMSFLNSVCQSPFVEMVMDTYQDEFEITVRQPPFNKKAIQSVVKEKSYITVSKSDILSYNIDNETEFYSYYEISPSSQAFGNEGGVFNSIIPIIPIPFYTERFGNVGYKIQDNYISRVSIEGNNGKKSENDLIKLTDGYLNDLIYVIESTVYLPFTRRGTITLNGDRRIKAKSFIYNEATNELFYVDSVSNSLSITNSSIDRVTTLSVSRGMVIDNIADTFTTLKYSYFEIVNTEKLKENLSGSIDKNSKKNKDFDIIVNEDVFDYFIQKNHLPKKFV